MVTTPFDIWGLPYALIAMDYYELTLPTGINAALLEQRRRQRLLLAQVPAYLQERLLPPSGGHIPPEPIRYLVEKRLRDLADAAAEPIRNLVERQGQYLVASEASSVITSRTVDIERSSAMEHYDAMESITNALYLEHTQTAPPVTQVNPAVIPDFRRLLALLGAADELAGDAVAPPMPPQ